LFLVPFFAVILSTLILGEKVALYEAIGSLLIIGALIISSGMITSFGSKSKESLLNQEIQVKDLTA
ncbi:MAG: hypothetical protein M0T78_05055, partial [Actinomycetota bacterium]|nr:hypothetical protein [Actinomycetota bacterium]